MRNSLLKCREVLLEILNERVLQNFRQHLGVTAPDSATARCGISAQRLNRRQFTGNVLQTRIFNV